VKQKIEKNPYRCAKTIMKRNKDNGYKEQQYKDIAII